MINLIKKRMTRLLFVGVILCVIISFQSFSQQSVASFSYHPPSQDKLSWQRLYLLLGSTFYRGMKLSRIGIDSSLLHVSRALGISRLAVAAEGIDDPELIKESKWFDERNPGAGIQLLSKAGGKKHLELLILLGSYYTFQPNSYMRYRDSSEHFLKAAINESKTSNEKRLGRVALCLLGKIYGTGADTANGNAVFNQLINECQQDHDRETEARAFYYRAIFTTYTPSPSNLLDKISWAQKAETIYSELKDTESEIAVLTNLAFMQMAASQFDNAYNNFVKALELEKSIGYPYTHYTSDHIAMLTMVQGKFGEPLKYTLETIKVSESVRDSIGWAEFYLRLGQLYYTEGGRSEESLKWMFKALNHIVAANDGNAYNLYTTVFNVVSLMNENSGREKAALKLVTDISKKFAPLTTDEQIFCNVSFASCYTSLQQYDLADQYILAADSIQKLSPALTIAGAYQRRAINSELTSLHFAKGEYKTVQKNIEESLASNSNMPILVDEIGAYRRLIYIDSVFRDASSGIKHYKEYTALMDSNFRVSSIRQAEELEVMYQTQEKEDQITLLNGQSKLEQAHLKRATLVRNVTIAGIILALLIAGLLYRQNRLEQKNNNLITNKNEQLQHLNEQLQHLLTEKDWLVKEIHHRVKNNLQTVMSLLGTQSIYLKNDIAINAITDSQRRIQAMSLIHQRLYQSNKLSAIRTTDYIYELVDSLNESFNTNNRIRFDMQIEPIELDLAHSIPLGLILNEAITNSFKHAFPNDHQGMISISLKTVSEDNYLLTIKDNGTGLPPGSNVSRTDSMGMNLMRGLSAEIGAQFTLFGQNGTQVDIHFVYDPDTEAEIALVKAESIYST